MFSIVLVCLGVFQEYIMTNIAQLIRLGHTKIYVLTNAALIPHFEPFSDVIHLVSVETLNDSFDFKRRSTQDKEYRGGFWHHTSARFFVLYEFMAQTGIKNVIHIENDVLIYYNCDKVLSVPLFNKSELYIPFDSYERNIASIVYIPDAILLAQILVHYNYEKNDMYNFSEIRKKTVCVQQFPIFVEERALDLSTVDGERAFVSHGWSQFGGYIFDAAAIGQYVGGVDPRNCPGDTRGFVNETCVIKYADEGTIIWKTDGNDDDVKRPFLQRNNQQIIPIFNLHIHSKALVLYV
jgi:hypothetical protein